jgi:AAA15 family ATPase/GTPase
MKLTRIHIHNYRSIIDVNIDAHDFIMFVGANNAGKSNCINALRCFYGDLLWTDKDFPKLGNQDEESWTELSFDLSNDEWKALDDKYKNDALSHSLVLKRYFKGEKAKVKQNNIYAVVDGDEQDKVFYAA